MIKRFIAWLKGLFKKKVISSIVPDGTIEEKSPDAIQKKLKRLGYIERRSLGSSFFQFLTNTAPREYGQGLRYKRRRMKRRRYTSRFPVWVEYQGVWEKW
ncbi:MAG TPA: hypothetical protein VJ044_18700 [Candidatus Hodarchaeales archaeon]|nr:hypothetical protein [Candidatus Hodarchaeales archaeon]